MRTIPIGDLQPIEISITWDGKKDLAWSLVYGALERVEDKVESIAPPELEWRRFGGTLSWLRLESEQKHTDEVGAHEAIRLMQESHPDKTGKPLFLALGFYRPHTPFVAPGRWYDAYPAEEIELAEVPPGDRENKPVAALADRRFQAEMTEQQKRQAGSRLAAEPADHLQQNENEPCPGGHTGEGKGQLGGAVEAILGVLGEGDDQHVAENQDDHGEEQRIGSIRKPHNRHREPGMRERIARVEGQGAVVDRRGELGARPARPPVREPQGGAEPPDAEPFPGGGERHRRDHFLADG